MVLPRKLKLELRIESGGKHTATSNPGQKPSLLRDERLNSQMTCQVEWSANEKIPVFIIKSISNELYEWVLFLGLGGAIERLSSQLHRKSAL